MAKRNNRLSCIWCDRTDFDGIDADQLEQCKRDGWMEIRREQTHEESIKTYDNSSDAPDSHSVLGRFTYLGICPDCKEL